MRDARCLHDTPSSSSRLSPTSPLVAASCVCSLPVVGRSRSSPQQSLTATAGREGQPRIAQEVIAARRCYATPTDVCRRQPPLHVHHCRLRTLPSLVGTTLATAARCRRACITGINGIVGNCGFDTRGRPVAAAVMHTPPTTPRTVRATPSLPSPYSPPLVE